MAGLEIISLELINSKYSIMFRYIRNLFWDIQFRWHEFKIGMKEGREADRIEQESANPMAGLIYYKQCEVERAERKRLHQLRKLK